MEKVPQIIKQYWNIDTLKDKQTELISHFIEGNDVIGLLPTGYGKSLCYLLPPLISNKVMIIISPLISLMDEQKEKLIEMKIPVAVLHGNNPDKQKEIFSIIDGTIKIVYMSPEYLIKGHGIELAQILIEKKLLGYLAIDESHCISAWGHDFRDDYLKINIFRKEFPSIPIMAVTATATAQVVQDIVKHLNMTKPKIVIANFDRPNIYLKCININKTNKLSLPKTIPSPKGTNDILWITKGIKIKSIKLEPIDYIDSYIVKYEGYKIIIYTSSRNATDELSVAINAKYGKISASYHAGMDKGKRNTIQTKFNNGTTNIIVSTVAFGMGIDQTVRCVLIFGSPKSIEEYYQMIGRGGRDGLAAESVLLFQSQYNVINKKMIEKSDMDIDIMRNKISLLNNIPTYTNSPICRRRYILEYFNQVTKFFWCNYCDNCCENPQIDLTKQFIDILFNNKSFEILNDSEQKIALAHNLIDTYGNPSNTMKNWKKIIEANKYMVKGIPSKYKISCNSNIKLIK